MNSKLIAIAWLALITPLIAFVPGCDDVSGDLQAVMDAYAEAERTGNGEAMLALIDPKNIEHYDRVAEYARTASYQEIQRLTSMDKYWIALLRADCKPAELKKMDGKTMVRLWVERRWGGDEYPRITLTDVKHRPPRATAEMIWDGEPTKIRMEFVKVNEQWLVNDECLDALFNDLVLKETRLTGASEERVLLDLVIEDTGRPVERKVWDVKPTLR